MNDGNACTARNLLISVLTNGRYHLIGDENGGVGLGCHDHFDGGRPLAYYDPYDGMSPYPDSEVVHATTIPALLAVAAEHEATAHGPEGDSVNIPAVPDSVTREQIRQAIEALGIDPAECAGLEIQAGAHAVYVTVYGSAVPGGSARYWDAWNDGEQAAKHHIAIPIAGELPPES